MANEILLTGSLVYDDDQIGPESIQITDLFASITTKVMCHQKIVVTTSERSIPLGDVAAPGYAMFVNRSASGSIDLRVATGGARFAKLSPGEFAILRLGSGAQAPYAIGTTTGMSLEYLLLDT